MKKPSRSDILHHGETFTTSSGHVIASASIQSTDAELYRIVVAHALREGRFASKADFDAEVRKLGTIDRADEILAFNLLRPGCGAWRRGNLMICECGVSWHVDAVALPICNKVSE